MLSFQVSLAIAVPTIGPFISLIGAFACSMLGLLVPVYVETVTYWEDGFGRYYWSLIKNFVIVVIGIMAFVLGTIKAIQDIIVAYK